MINIVSKTIGKFIFNNDWFTTRLIRYKSSSIRIIYYHMISDSSNSFYFSNKGINFKVTNLEKKSKTKDIDTSLLEKELSLKLGLKLTISDKNNKGNIKIEYRTISQREKIIQKLKD